MIFQTKFMDKQIELCDVKLHYRVSGSGPALILMHGWGCNVSTVASIENVASRTHTVYNIDLPGFGQSTEPSFVWGVEDYTRMLEEFVRTLGISRPSLIGHSFGGRISILYSSRNDVDKVILVDAAGVKPKRKPKYYLKVYSFKAGKFLANTFLPQEKASKIIDKMRGSGSSDYAQASPRMRAILSKCVNEDLKSVMPDIKAPTLLIWGEQDTATPLSDAKVMEKLIPEAALVSFPGCGHYSFLDNPVQFAAVLDSFLKS